TGTNVEPFAISPGDTLELTVGTDNRIITFAVDDIETPGAATAEEIAIALVNGWDGLLAAYADAGALSIDTVARGGLASLETHGGPTSAVLGLGAAAVYHGTDHGQVSVYSNKAGVEATIQVVGGSANAVLGFDTDEVGSTGGAVLAPDDSYTLYSFDIETENVLTSAQEVIVRKVAEYMKPAHTHLIDIRTASPLPWPESWVLGISELEESTELGE
ncbi:MAG: hypothetical protein ABFD77_02770, partial [Thermotogota bacterium]